MSAGPIAALLAAALVIFWMLGAYNRLMALRNAIGRTWTRVDEARQQRSVALVALAAALREPLAAEHGALDALLAAQGRSARAAAAMAGTGPPSDAAAAEWVAAEAALAAATSRVMALLDQHPELQRQDPVAVSLRGWRDGEPRLAFVRQLFNETVQGYNDALAQFPTRMLVGLFGLQPAARL